MEFSLKELKFGYIISHTFPGLILAIELLFLVDMSTERGIWYSILQEIKNFSNLVGIIGVFAVFATMLGLIIDAFQHLAFESIHWIYCLARRGKYEIYAVHEVIKKEEHLKIYNYLVVDALWYYYEGYCNTAISLIPGIYIIPSVLQRLGISGNWISGSRYLILFVILVLLVEGAVTYGQSRKTERKLAQTLKAG